MRRNESAAAVLIFEILSEPMRLVELKDDETVGVVTTLSVLVAFSISSFRMPARFHIALLWMVVIQLARAGSEPAGEMPSVRFTDITKASGITFVHINGAYGEKLLPETMGGGVAFFDYDNDSRPDLLFINSTYWPGHSPAGKPPTMALYHNEG